MEQRQKQRQRQRYLLYIALLFALVLVGSRFTAGTARAMGTWLPSAAPTPGAGAMSVYTVSNGTSSPISVQHDFVDQNGSTVYSFTASVPANGSAEYHVRDMTAVPVPFEGSVRLSADVAFTAQVTGYDYPPQVTFLPKPARAVDTRPNSGIQGAGLPLNGYASYRRYTLTGQNVPTNATAVLVNLTAVGYPANGWLAAYPACTTLPSTSSLNFDTRENAIANFAIVRLGTSASGTGCQGAIDVTGLSGTNVLVDVVGYLVTPSLPQTSLLDKPIRVVDTRANSGYLGAGAPLQGTSDPHCYTVAGAGQGAIPSGVQGVIVNLTAVGYSSDGWLTAYPAGGTVPATSSLNYDTSENAIANTAVVKVGTNGQICLLSSARTDAIVDISGYLK